MPTQEERIQSLEKAMVNFSESVRDLNHYVTMLVGVVGREEEDIREMKFTLRSMDGRLTFLEQKFDMQDRKLDQILALLSSKPE